MNTLFLELHTAVFRLFSNLKYKFVDQNNLKKFDKSENDVKNRGFHKKNNKTYRACALYMGFKKLYVNPIVLFNISKNELKNMTHSY